MGGREGGRAAGLEEGRKGSEGGREEGKEGGREGREGIPAGRGW